MSFKLKNVGATYQWLVIKIFQPMLGRMAEVYINDMLVKILNQTNYINHFEEAFNLFQKYGIKLNLLKCVFRVSEEKFLGFMITRRRIEANLAQIKTILEFPSSNSRKKVQQFSRRLATLGRFISRFTNHLCLLFNTLRGGKVNRMDP